MMSASKLEIRNTLLHFGVDLEDVLVYAYIASGGVTSISSINTYIPIEGPFVNKFIERFELGEGYIKYIGSKRKIFRIHSRGSVSSSKNGTNITIALKIYDKSSELWYIEPASEVPCSLEKGKIIPLPPMEINTCLSTGDKIQSVIKADRTCEITFNAFRTSLSLCKLKFEQ